jgi:hypothetical protein
VLPERQHDAGTPRRVAQKDLPLLNDLHAAMQHEKHHGMAWTMGLLVLLVATFLVWAWFSNVEEVTRGQGSVIPSSREQVILALGSPSTKATFDNEVYYYISQTRKRSMAFQNPHIVDQRVLAVYFGEDGRVTNIANYGLKDGKVFDFVSRTTPTGGKDQTFIGQILAGVSGLPSVPGGSGQPTR